MSTELPKRPQAIVAELLRLVDESFTRGVDALDTPAGLSAANELATEVERQLTDGQPANPALLNALMSFYWRRYQLLSRPRDLEACLQLTSALPDPDPERPPEPVVEHFRLMREDRAYRAEFEARELFRDYQAEDDLIALDAAIDRLTWLTEHLGQSRTSPTEISLMLGVALSDRYKSSRNQGDIDRCISELLQAEEGAAGQSDAMVPTLLAEAFRDRFNQFDRPSDLEQGGLFTLVYANE